MGGWQATSETLKKSDFLEHKGKWKFMRGKQAIISHKDKNTFSKIVQQFGGARGSEKVSTQSNSILGNLTPMKRRLIQNENIKILISHFEK